MAHTNRTEEKTPSPFGKIDTLFDPVSFRDRVVAFNEENSGKKPDYIPSNKGKIYKLLDYLVNRIPENQLSELSKAIQNRTSKYLEERSKKTSPSAKETYVVECIWALILDTEDLASCRITRAERSELSRMPEMPIMLRKTVEKKMGIYTNIN